MNDISTTCFACDGGTTVNKSDDIALCTQHWNRWLIAHIGPLAPEPPCSAHLIQEPVTR